MGFNGRKGNYEHLYFNLSGVSGTADIVVLYDGGQNIIIIMCLLEEQICKHCVAAYSFASKGVS